MISAFRWNVNAQDDQSPLTASDPAPGDSQVCAELLIGICRVRAIAIASPDGLQPSVREFNLIVGISRSFFVYDTLQIVARNYRVF